MTDTAFTADATVALAVLEQVHGQVSRVRDDIPSADDILSLSLTGTRVFMCRNCQAIFSISPEGEVRVWHWDAEYRPYSFGREDFRDE